MHIAGITSSPDLAFMAQVARNPTDHVDGFLRDKCYLIGDKACVFTVEFENSLADAGVKLVRTAATKLRKSVTHVPGHECYLCSRTGPPRGPTGIRPRSVQDQAVGCLPRILCTKRSELSWPALKPRYRNLPGRGYRVVPAVEVQGGHAKCTWIALRSAIVAVVEFAKVSCGDDIVLRVPS